MTTNTNDFLSILTRFDWLGNWLFLLLAFIECVPVFGAFFPGGALISIAGFFAAQGYFNVWYIIIFGTIGAVLGDYMGYTLGWYNGDWIRNKKIFKPKLIAKGERFFEKYGPVSIFWGRFIGMTRAVVPFIAGSSKMSPKKFFMWNALSAVTWGFANTAVGYFTGSVFSKIIKNISHQVGLVLIILLCVAALYWFIKKQGQNTISFFKTQSEHIGFWITSRPWFVKLSQHYPLAADFFTMKISKRFNLIIVLGFIVLIVFYITVVILDLV